MVISTTNPRDLKALAALKSSGGWAKIRDASGKALAYGVPSATMPNRYHLTNSTQCTCKDAEYGNLCYHSRAVALHVTLTKAAR